ncbi:hypothetical protein BKA67DRAFT_571016 [Truncatella angustata]|uniref:Uncharacterized protein n=1 Tax=Truncatella angustata TaxID=152316 RepID=A0A9P8UG23_9PEZI|nr:uncharacterized protein BKA67DRAFT_571016 [Truncatella angustata]KAH6651463.1 hypothetical protein BKA67DRAFT_571016 [Truncatella angustata]
MTLLLGLFELRAPKMPFTAGSISPWVVSHSFRTYAFVLVASMYGKWDAGNRQQVTGDRGSTEIYYTFYTRSVSMRTPKQMIMY